jgi:predicted transcriptional regulator
MRKIKDVLRLKLDAKLSHQQIADALGLSKGVVTKYIGLAAAAGLDWLTVQAMDEAPLERRLLAGSRKAQDYVQPKYGRMHHA